MRKRYGRFGFVLSPEGRNSEEILTLSGPHGFWGKLLGFEARLFRQEYAGRKYYFLVGAGGPLSPFGRAEGCTDLPSTARGLHEWVPGEREELVVIDQALARELLREHGKVEVD